MTDTANLGLPFIEGSQAQKHVTHNEALRILDATVQLSVADRTLNTPPASPVDGERHIVGSSPTGAWSGHSNAIAVWQDDSWALISPRSGWCAWCIADDALLVYDGSHWRAATVIPTLFDNLGHLGVNTSASSPNLLSVRSNAALLNAIDTGSGGSGDVRLQLNKSSSGNTASVTFSDAWSGRAEFGLIGNDSFGLKVSNDGSSFTDALSIDASSGNLTLPNGLFLKGVISPPQITANQNDYAPSGFSNATMLKLWSDASRSISGLGGGAEGRVIIILNTGGQTITLLNESTSSSAANRFSLGADLAVTTRQAVTLRYDSGAARWYSIAR